MGSLCPNVRVATTVITVLSRTRLAGPVAACARTCASVGEAELGASIARPAIRAPRISHLAGLGSSSSLAADDLAQKEQPSNVEWLYYSTRIPSPIPYGGELVRT